MKSNLTTTQRRELKRFVEAQEGVYASVLEELTAGKKMSHWMWFVFPQLKALGKSPTAQYFGLESKDEALAYWQNEVLRERLKQCTKLVLSVSDKTAHEIFGFPDDMKFGSCMTLFSQIEPEEPIFRQALERFFGGQPDASTLELLQVPAACG